MTMEDCLQFQSNKWKTDLCVNCQKHAAEHKGFDSTTLRQEKRSDNVENERPILDKKKPPSQDSPVSQVKKYRTNTLDTGQKTNTTNFQRTSPSKSLYSSQIPTVTQTNQKSPSNSLEGRKKPSKRPSEPPPAPTSAVVRRSVSVRTTNKPPVSQKPQTLRKPVFRSGSLQVKWTTKPETGKPESAGKHSVATCEHKKYSRCDTHTTISGVKLPSDRSEAHPSSETGQKAMADEHQEETFHNTLNNLEIDQSQLHPEDYAALQNAWTFFNYKNYHERLHESPFHKLAAKIKEHHSRHNLQNLVGNNSQETRPEQPYINTESFYGSVDVTQTSPLPSNYEACGSNSSNNSGSLPYDNARPEEATPGQSTALPLTVDVYRSVNGPATLSPPPGSPRYDRVPNRMETSQESTNSERIYAEVLDLDVKTPQMDNSQGLAAGADEMSQYEEVNLQEWATSISANVSNKVIHTVKAANKGSSGLQQSARSPRTLTKMSFLKTILGKKGKKDLVSPLADHKPADGESVIVKVTESSVGNGELNHTAIIDDSDHVKEISTQKTQKIEPTKQPTASVDVTNNLTISTNHDPMTKSCSKRGSSGAISPRESRPEVKPPPPPNDPKPMSKSTSSTLSANSKLHKISTAPQLQNTKIILTKDKNGDFVPISPKANRKTGKSPKLTPENGLYDEPWGDTQQVITGILKQEGTMKNGRPIPAKNGVKNPGVNLRLPDAKGQKKGHGMGPRHTSMPAEFHEERRSSYSGKGGKSSPPSSAIDSGYESSATLYSTRKSAGSVIMTKGDSSNSRLSLPGSAANSRPSSPQTKLSAVDSPHICLEQIGAMNVGALQKLCKTYMESKQLEPEKLEMSWNDMIIKDSTEILHHNNRCVFYQVEMKDRPQQPYTAMLSLKPPAQCKAYTPHLLPVANMLKVEVKPALFPEQIISSYKSISPSSTGERSTVQNGASDSTPSITVTDASVKTSSSQEEDNSYDKPWHSLLEQDAKALEVSYKEGLMRREKANEFLSEDIDAYVTLLPRTEHLTSVQNYLQKRTSECQHEETFVMDSLFILIQVLNMLFNLSERFLQVEILSANDLCVTLDEDEIPTVVCHMLSVRKSSVDFKLTCEKLRMFVIQLGHLSERLAKSTIFKKVEDLITNSTDQGDLKTISLIIQYLLWGPKSEEIKIMSVAESRKQAFDLWIQLARAKLVNRLAMVHMNKLKICMIANFLVNTSGQELFKITKLLSTVY